MSLAAAERALVDGLAAATAAFEAGDEPGGSAALDGVVAACAALDAAGATLAPDVLDLARRRWEACGAAAVSAARALGRELQSAGMARRAVDAYRR